jgi:hypothetical protein
MVGCSIAHFKQLFQVNMDSADRSRYSDNCSSDVFQSSAKETIETNGFYFSTLAFVFCGRLVQIR